MDILGLDDIRILSEEAYLFLKEKNIFSLPEGIYNLQKGIYAIIESYDTKKHEESQYESHRKYVDIQYIISGEEKIRVESVDKLHVLKPYEFNKDITYYDNNVKGDLVRLPAGKGLAFYPKDGHMPCLNVDESERGHVKKAIIKIPIALFKNIKVLVMDVDGTLTDGKIYMGINGEIMKAFDIKDGCGIHDILPRVGICPIIITGRKSAILQNRCDELGIIHVYQGVSDKETKLDELLEFLNVKWSEVAYIGDDVNDLECMRLVKKSGGLVACPIDAVQQVKDIADYITEKTGGNGSIREFIDWFSRGIKHEIAI